jgi:ribosome-binding factor A
MPKEYSRTLRVAEQIQRELAQLIQQELKDPRIGMVTVADVEVATDLAHARVYVAILGDADCTQDTVKALNHAAGFLRRELSHRLSLRATPALRFIHDQTTEKANQLAALLNNAKAAAGQQQDPEE